MPRLLWVGVAVLIIGLVMLVAGFADVAFQHFVLPIIVLLFGLVLVAVGWRRRAPRI